MHIQREIPDNHTIRSYTDDYITIGSHTYQKSIIVSNDTIVSPWFVHSIRELNETTLKPMLELQPEIIILGHHNTKDQVPIEMVEYLSKRRIGMEPMSIGAACRTFNVLLGEQRMVVLGIIL